MQAQCQSCGAKYVLDDAKVAQHAKVQFKCAKCGTTTVLDTRAAPAAPPTLAASVSRSGPAATAPPAAPEKPAARVAPAAPASAPAITAPAAPEASPSPESTQAVSPLPSFARGGGGGSAAGGTIVSQYQGLALPADKSVTLSVIAGPAKGATLKMTKPRAVIGRSGADFEVNDPEVSRSHCAIELKNDIVRLRDLDSTNGIFLEEERVRVAELQHLSEFRIGATTILVQITPKHE